ncbi:hypothetical protein EYS09_03185 [Streptomyces kasugaensis]|uniref:Uncharacterized protein n=1 Tax=Streptomyces kasugaensis TaxID=1946 RepID=A0A4Q9I071_STRKA|nr:hypothetical protein [Streptomyces kasugaensis]TBO61054.1 hypothetical protein EYS09_03185 [Streptomyces kasugaensis]
MAGRRGCAAAGGAALPEVREPPRAGDRRGAVAPDGDGPGAVPRGLGTGRGAGRPELFPDAVGVVNQE